MMVDNLKYFYSKLEELKFSVASSVILIYSKGSRLCFDRGKNKSEFSIDAGDYFKEDSIPMVARYHSNGIFMHKPICSEYILAVSGMAIFVVLYSFYVDRSDNSDKYEESIPKLLFDIHASYR
jgi:hypothetical protein